MQDEKRKALRAPVFPKSWKDQFGLPFQEHRQSMQINILDGYAVYALQASRPPSINMDGCKEEGML